MPDYKDHKIVLDLLSKAQDADSDNRDKVREVNHFLDKPDGQWEPDIINKFRDNGRPRYTFDQCNDIVDDVAGELEQSEFGVTIRPAGGGANEDIAEIYAGLVRNIQSYSYADDIYDSAGRNMIAAGFDAWRINQRWGNTDTFDQDLYIDGIANAIDSVWFEPTSYERTHRDGNYAFVLEAMSPEAYKEKWPDGSGTSIGTDRTREVYSHKPETIVVGEILYKTTVERTIVEMTDGSIYAKDEDFEKIQDELAAKGNNVVRERKRKAVEVKTRLFDGADWLNEEQDTVFSLIPIIPVYGNFKVSENKVLYWGKITKKMDAQRVYNYSESRKVENGVLQPRPKTYMSREQAAADTETLKTMNTNSNPVQTYTHVDGQTPPYQSAGPQPDLTLEGISGNALLNLQSNRPQIPGQPVGLQSGVAVELTQNKEDTKNQKYFKALEVAICYTGEVLVDGIPGTYDSKRQIRLLKDDGTSSMVTLHDVEFDTESQEMVEINDLSQGIYDVVCDVAPLFKNRQQETVAAFNEVATIDPSIIERGKDIWLSNINAPGMDQMAERARADLIQAGAIPIEQMTDEEKAELEAQQQAAQNEPPPPDPLMLAAQAEQQNAQTTAQKQADDTQIRVAELQLESRKLDQSGDELAVKREANQFQALLDQNKQQNDNLSAQISGLGDLLSAFGVDAVGGSAPAELVKQQGALVDETQDNM